VKRVFVLFFLGCESCGLSSPTACRASLSACSLSIVLRLRLGIPAVFPLLSRFSFFFYFSFPVSQQRFEFSIFADFFFEQYAFLLGWGG